ncbi:unnamed protein product, partial [Phaeothamnion confervicola]
MATVAVTPNGRVPTPFAPRNTPSSSKRTQMPPLGGLASIEKENNFTPKDSRNVSAKQKRVTASGIKKQPSASKDESAF